MKKEMLFLGCLAAVSLSACSDQSSKKESTLSNEDLKKEGQLIQAQVELSYYFYAHTIQLKASIRHLKPLILFSFKTPIIRK